MKNDEFDIFQDDTKDVDHFNEEEHSGRSQILLIDDDKVFRDSVTFALNNSFDVINCDSGAAGLQALNDSLKAVVLDIKMSSMDGFETYKRIKEILPNIPIIFNSAYQDLKDPMDILNNFRPFAYLSKSGNLAELVDTLNSGINYYDKLNENKILVDELQKLNATLEEKVIERTKELKQANDDKNKFFSIIAHDLRGPFHTLIGLSELLEQSYDELNEEEKRSFISEIYKSSNSTFKLLENLLEWASVQINGIKFTPENIELKKLVDDVLEGFASYSKKKDISCNSSVEEKLHAYSDPKMLMFIIRNLTSNAFKFTNPGGSINISAQRLDKYLEIIVADTGIGMSEENVKKLFKVNEKVKSEGTQKEPGSGLGLILCKEFIIKNRGHIRVESKPKEGSKFIFTLPLPV